MRCRLALAGLALLLSAAPASSTPATDPRVVVEDLLTASAGLDDLDAMGEEL